MKKIVIVGSGESGTGAALLAKRMGYDVFVSDKSPIAPVYQQQLEQHGIPFEAGVHTPERILTADEIIKSPGIPNTAPLIQQALEKGIPIIGEIEFGFRYAPACQIVAITGTNGKTTTTKLTYHLFKSAGKRAYMGGNVGTSFAGLVLQVLDEPAGDLPIFILEVSSFQLDDTRLFHPQVAILLNITPDHLDRYDYQMANYMASKFQITRQQEAQDLFILSGFDPYTQQYIASHPEFSRAKVHPILSTELQNGYVRVLDYAFDLSSTQLKGPHNHFNAACAIRAALELGLDASDISEALLSFAPPAHRMERVAVAEGITWINDSKATNVDAVQFALQAMDSPTIWVVGGTDKGNDYQPLLDLVRQKVKAIVCLGVDNHKLVHSFSALGLPMVETQRVEEAVRQAAAWAHPGDTVLLSPACASFDLFKNYEDRGDQFRAAVLNYLNPTHS
ncbi:MAG: UDP-N-acetylmuramoyl-L-alanine--D-glutamate ligase [Chitinophagales bacterium]|jgi:UDP-N-acetylmuramoylalanine--D-glutamate ligase